MKERNFFDLKLEKATSGEIIKAFRKNFQITQKELAEVTGIAETNLSAIENNKIEIGVKRAVLIGAALGLDPSFILFPEGGETMYHDEVKSAKKASLKMLAKKKVS